MSGSKLMPYEKLIKECESNNLIVKEKNMTGYNGLIYGNRVAIRKDLTSAEKVCVLAEELGHYYTTYGNILDQTDIKNLKQEYRAKGWAYKRLISIECLINTYLMGLSTPYEMAEFLNITEEFLHEAITYYKDKYGLYHEVAGYLVCFEPFKVVKLVKR